MERLLQSLKDIELVLTLCWEAGIIISAMVLSPLLLFSYFGKNIPKYLNHILYIFVIVHIVSRCLRSKLIREDIPFYYDNPIVDFLIGLCLCIYSWSLILKYLLNYDFPEIYDLISGGFLFLFLMTLLAFILSRISPTLSILVTIILMVMFFRGPFEIAKKLGIFLQKIHGAPLFYSIKMIVFGSKLGISSSFIRD